MTPERIEELVSYAMNEMLHDIQEDGIREALRQCAMEVNEEVARVCDRWSGVGDAQVALPLAIGIRALVEKLK